MRVVTALGLVVFLSACAAATVATPASVLAPTGVLPDTIACDHPLVVKARSEGEGIDAERAWLNAQYPNHTPYAQALAGSKGRWFDILTFITRDGRPISVCFDITSFYGRF